MFQSPCGDLLIGNPLLSSFAINTAGFQSPCGDLLIGNVDVKYWSKGFLLFQSPCGDLLIGNIKSLSKYLAPDAGFSPLAGIY